MNDKIAEFLSFSLKKNLGDSDCSSHYFRCNHFDLLQKRTGIYRQK